MLTRLGVDHGQVRERTLALIAGERDQSDVKTRLANDLVDTAEQLDRVRREKEAAFDAGDLEAAAALRNQESQPLVGKLRLEHQLTANAGEQALIAENCRLHNELERLRNLLRDHGIKPDGGAARTA